MAPSLPQSLCRGLSSSHSLPQTCAEVSVAPKFGYSYSQSHSILNAPPWLQMHSGAGENALAESQSTLQTSRGGWEHLKVLESSGEGYRSVWEVCISLLDQITFCWCSVHLISVSKWISKPGRSQLPSTWLRSDGGCKAIKGGVTEVDRVMGSMYLADPRVDRCHLTSIWSFHTMKIHTLSFPTCGLTWSVRGYVNLQRQVALYLLIWFLCFWMGASWCSSDYARLRSAARLTLCIYIKRLTECMP
jgi:hypothetical protein